VPGRVCVSVCVRVCVCRYVCRGCPLMRWACESFVPVCVCAGLFALVKEHRHFVCLQVRVFLRVSLCVSMCLRVRLCVCVQCPESFHHQRWKVQQNTSDKLKITLNLHVNTVLILWNFNVSSKKGNWSRGMILA